MKRDSSLLQRVPRAAWVLFTGTFAGTAIFLATSFGPTGSIASRGSIDEQTPTPQAQDSQAMFANSTNTATNTSTSTSTATASPTIIDEVSSSTEGAVHPDNISEEQPVAETAETAPAVGTSRFVMPLSSWVVVTDRFGAARGAGLVHGGIDLALNGGNDSPVMASCNGTASTAYNSTYGYHVIVNCGGGWATLYAHLSEILVRNGQAVAQYGVLGLSGSTGFSTGEHLHFEIHFNGVRVNPEWYLDFKIPAGTPLSSGPIWYSSPGAGLNPAIPAGSGASGGSGSGGSSTGSGGSGGGSSSGSGGSTSGGSSTGGSTSGGTGGSGGASATAASTSTSATTSTATAEPKATNTPVPPTNTPPATATATSTFTPTATFTPQPPTPTRTPTPKPVFIP